MSTKELQELEIYLKRSIDQDKKNLLKLNEVLLILKKCNVM